MGIKFTIVVPHYGDRTEDLLKPCLSSIKQFTNLEECEVLVVCNGTTLDSKTYTESLGAPFRAIWYDEAIGYARACNRGIEQANGEYIVLLNNDTVVLDQTPKSSWLNILESPFLQDEQTAVTGPMMAWSPSAKDYFLIGFCTMFKKAVLDIIGLYDESFDAYGEDTDICLRAVSRGYRIYQVPDEIIRRVDHSDSVGTGNFPLWHKGNESYRNWPGGVELLTKNNKILFDRWGINNPDIEKAQKCDGFINDRELQWLGREASKRKRIVEIGSWHGKSSRAIGDNLSPGGVLYCVDTWAGSVAEQETNHSSAKWKDGDHAFYEFLQNNIDLVQEGKIVPLRMTSKNAAEFFKEKNISFDMIFIDAGHTYPEVCQDIDNWKGLIKEGGIFCGHDFNGWAGVNEAVSEKIETFNVGSSTTIWYCNKENIKARKPCVFDCFPFNNEYEILERRLSELYDVVDRFVIVEATRTHGNIGKPLNFNNNLERFSKWLNKITYIVVNDYPATDSWSIERHQRDAIMRGLNDCQPNDIIMISDCDEIPSIEAIKSYVPEMGIRAFKMDLYYYNEKTKAKDPWVEAKILPYSLLREKTPCGARYTQCESIQNGGKHLSYFGCSDDIEKNIDRIIKKIEDTAHREYDTPYMKDRERIRKALLNGEDVFGRDYVKFETV